MSEQNTVVLHDALMTTAPKTSFLRSIAGSPLTRTELVIGFAFGILWFTMDLIQWIDWLVTKTTCGTQ